jgi:type IV pilus assembly protein PilM
MFNFDIKKSFSLRPRTSVGLDLGKYAVKLLEVEHSGEKSVLRRIGFKKLSDPSKETLVNSVRSLAEELSLSAKEVNISVSGPSTIVRFVSMPKMREDELKGAIRFEAEKHIPFSIDDCIIDYQILRKNEKENKIEMLLVAAKKAFITERISIAEECGFTVSLIDVDSFAMTNSFLKNFSDYEASKSAAVLGIGAGITNVSIVQGGVLRFCRDIAMGGAEITSAISKGLNVDAKTAENVKLAPGARLQEIAGFAKNTLNSLIDEIGMSFTTKINQAAP